MKTNVEAVHARTSGLANARILSVVGEEAPLDPILPVMEDRRARPPDVTLGAACPSQVNDGEGLQGISGCEENVIAINAVGNCNNCYTVQRVVAR
jgi:hypothetical protein